MMGSRVNKCLNLAECFLHFSVFSRISRFLSCGKYDLMISLPITELISEQFVNAASIVVFLLEKSKMEEYN